MLCNICGKNEATVHLTEIVNDKMTKLHLCEDCAKKKGTEMEEHFGMSDLLAGLADLSANVEPGDMKEIKCPVCGFTYQDFKKLGRLGCGDCYEAFRKQLDPLLKRIHGANRHVGKVPLMVGKNLKEKRTLQDMRMQLEKAITAEEFEEAARIRDMIRDLENGRAVKDDDNK